MGVRELRQSACELLGRVAAGASIEITNHGRPVAHLVPIPSRERSSRAQLIDLGVLRPGRGDLLDVLPVRAPERSTSTAYLLADGHDDR